MRPFALLVHLGLLAAVVPAANAGAPDPKSVLIHYADMAHAAYERPSPT